MVQRYHIPRFSAIEYGVDCTNNFSRPLLFPDHTQEEIIPIYREFKKKLRLTMEKRYWLESYETHSFHDVLKNDADSPFYKSSLTFPLFYCGFELSDIEKIEMRNKHMVGFMKFLYERNVPFAERLMPARNEFEERSHLEFKALEMSGD